MEKGRIKVKLNLEIVPNKCDTRVNIIKLNFFFCGERYFSFYSGIWVKRARKRVTWVFELLNRHSIVKPIRIIEGATPGYYKYQEVTISPYLLRRIIKSSANPEIDPYEN